MKKCVIRATVAVLSLLALAGCGPDPQYTDECVKDTTVMVTTYIITNKMVIPITEPQTVCVSYETYVCDSRTADGKKCQHYAPTGEIH